ncbi:MAG TPA: LON peptidase substrate-binding domain-containing protein, partial [Spirochaetota bacterium]|nr:LON peptidase substrate-binding domain-containing protein [Spirochaetota bacterium]
MPDDSQNIIESKHLILPSEILPEIIPIIPISHRPIFPGMMVPLVLTGDTMLNTARAIAESDNKIGGVVLIQNQREGMVTSSDLYKVGVSIKILKIAPIDENTIQVMVNALKRFTLVQVITEEPVIRWQVDHHYEPAAESTDEMKAYSAAILSSVKELIKSNALFQEELKLFLNRFSLEDPGKLADFVASLTSAEPSEVQEVLETFDVKQRVEKVLLLLKKELELSKLQKKISQQIEERIAKNQKEFFLREQLK